MVTKQKICTTMCPYRKGWPLLEGRALMCHLSMFLTPIDCSSTCNEQFFNYMASCFVGFWVFPCHDMGSDVGNDSLSGRAGEIESGVDE